MISRILVVVAAIALSAPVLEAQQGRRLDRIPTVEKSSPSVGFDQPLPSRERVVSAVQRIASRYGSDRLREVLAEEFPNRLEVIDEQRRFQQRALDIRLDVESIESVDIRPWRVVGERQQGTQHILELECLASVDVRTRLSYEELEDRRRVVRPVGRAQWHLRFTTTAVAAP